MAAPFPPPGSTRPSYRAKPLFWKGRTSQNRALPTAQIDVCFGSLAEIASPKRKSALPPKADVRRANQHVGFGPQGDSCGAANNALFDHLVGTREQHGRNGEAERLRGP